jgi:hypothetical protein
MRPEDWERVLRLAQSGLLAIPGQVTDLRNHKSLAKAEQWLIERGEI